MNPILVSTMHLAASTKSQLTPPCSVPIGLWWTEAIFLAPGLHLLGQCSPKGQLQIEPGALRLGPKRDTIGRKSELGREGFEQRVSIDGSLAIHVGGPQAEQLLMPWPKSFMDFSGHA
jgi:hypothetical protein